MCARVAESTSLAHYKPGVEETSATVVSDNRVPQHRLVVKLPSFEQRHHHSDVNLSSDASSTVSDGDVHKQPSDVTSTQWTVTRTATIGDVFDCEGAHDDTKSEQAMTAKQQRRRRKKCHMSKCHM